MCLLNISTYLLVLQYITPQQLGEDQSVLMDKQLRSEGEVPDLLQGCHSLADD